MKKLDKNQVEEMISCAESLEEMGNTILPHSLIFLVEDVKDHLQVLEGLKEGKEVTEDELRHLQDQQALFNKHGYSLLILKIIDHNPDKDIWEPVGLPNLDQFLEQNSVMEVCGGLCSWDEEGTDLFDPEKELGVTVKDPCTANRSESFLEKVEQIKREDLHSIRSAVSFNLASRELSKDLNFLFKTCFSFKMNDIKPDIEEEHLDLILNQISFLKSGSSLESLLSKAVHHPLDELWKPTGFHFLDERFKFRFETRKAAKLLHMN